MFAGMDWPGHERLLKVMADAAAAAAARALGRAELADSLIGSLPDGIDKQFALLRHSTLLAILAPPEIERAVAH